MLSNNNLPYLYQSSAMNKYSECQSYLDLVDERPPGENLGLQQLVLQRCRPLGHLGQPREVPLDVGLLVDNYLC